MTARSGARAVKAAPKKAVKATQGTTSKQAATPAQRKHEGGGGYGIDTWNGQGNSITAPTKSAELIAKRERERRAKAK